MLNSSNVDPVKPPADLGKGRVLPIVVVVATLLLVFLCVAGYLYFHTRFDQLAPATQISDETERITSEIASFLEVPSDETPTLATVTDKEKLAAQPFFQRAENGDKVLIYSKSGRAILYRPSTKKVIDVTTVDTKQTVAPEPTTTTAAVPPVAEPTQVESSTERTQVTVTLYNGSKKVGVTHALEKSMEGEFPDVVVLAKEKATRDDYQGNVVVDISGKNKKLAEEIALGIDGIIGSLPEGEAAPSGDLLIIVGNRE